MYGSAFYKHDARGRLAGCYGAALLGTIIYMIPSYLLYLLNYMIARFTDSPVTYLLDIAFQIFVINIFSVGYMRFLQNIKPAVDGMERRFDYNDILSGYTCGFKNTLKTMLLRDVYILLWALIAFIPAFVYIGIIAFLAVKTDAVANLCNMLLQLAASPSGDMINNIVSYVSENCPMLPAMTMITLIATGVCCVPAVYKSYEYAALPMILADDHGIGVKAAFLRSFNVMHGYRWKYFCIQFSFLPYMLLASVIFTVTMSIPIYYLAQTFFLPYMYMTLLAFYNRRVGVIEHNISVYGENERKENNI